ncbi:MAG: family 10 glycosylhydrolase [Oscillospiraceae bacterium]|nr:family 10 glycosylhydrolase [Oscillospiraceae bacterium]
MKTRGRLIAAALLLVIVVGRCSVLEWVDTVELNGQVFENGDGRPDYLPDSPRGDNLGSGSDFAYYEAVAVSRGEFRAVWVTTVFNLDFPSRQGISADAMKSEIDAIIARTVELGLNAIIFQVRPTGDAFYESDIFPWSSWLSGTQGQGIPGFDPLQYWIEASHANGLELHAWINPYRIIHTTTNSSDPNTLAPTNPVRLRPELAVGWTDPSSGRRGLFLDPGLPDARQLIIDGIENLIRRYDVDGIHFDDYFYPGSDFDDAATFARYGGEMSLGDWRRENVNTLIRDIQSIVRELNEELGRNVRWGISPTAIWKNASTDPLGVPTTRGQESYHALYADTRRWVLEGWVDYINPQIYWYIGFAIADFEAVLNWWIDLCGDSDVDLYIGLAPFREYLDHQPPRWRGETVRQLEMMAQSDVVRGSVFFRHEFLLGSVGDAIRDFYIARDAHPPERQPVMILDTLAVGTPEHNMTITAEPAASTGVNITGTSDPAERLYLNGAEVTNRTIEGFFFVFAPIEPGVNMLTFTQEGQSDVTRTVTRNPPAPAPPPGPAPTITQVTTPTYVTVTSDAAWVFPRNTTSGGSDWMMPRGSRDRVTAEATNGFLRLSSGKWIQRGSVSIRTESAFIEDVLEGGVYHVGMNYDMIVWQSEVFPAAHAGFDGRVLTVRFGMHTEPPPLALPDDLSETIFASVSSGMDGDTPYHAFTIRDDVRFEGQYIDFTDGEFRLHLKKRKSLAQGDQPLEGIVFVLDAGHGGDDYGALGPLGRAMPEKDIVLANTFKLYERLVNLGATVYLTRNADATVPLQQRVDLSRQVRPDLFISLHVNSVLETLNATNIRGFTVWYRNPGSANFSQTVLNVMYYINPGTNRHRNINQANFFVCRPQWAPSVILESSFIVNIDDFVWLIDPVQQKAMADATVEAILEYFS